VRPSDWQIGVSVQQQIVPRVSVEVGYFRRWLTHFSGSNNTVNDNLLTTPANYDSFSITAPSDPRLPGGGNYTVSGLYDITPTLFVNLIEPGSLYGDRVNELDLRIAKVLRFGRTRTNVGFDIYNVLNANPVLTYNNAFIANGAWLVPTTVLQARFVKLSASI